MSHQSGVPRPRSALWLAAVRRFGALRPAAVICLAGITTLWLKNITSALIRPGKLLKSRYAEKLRIKPERSSECVDATCGRVVFFLAKVGKIKNSVSYCENKRLRMENDWRVFSGLNLQPKKHDNRKLHRPDPRTKDVRLFIFTSWPIDQPGTQDEASYASFIYLSDGCLCLLHYILMLF